MSAGASAATSKFFEEYKKKSPENNLCFECGRQNPQWASVNCALLICLDCAGKHRKLGVHLSFVRSLTMDGWSDRQISFMQYGGNLQAQLWMERYSLKELELNNKYSSPVMESYREKLKALVENRAFTDPTPEEMAKKISPYGSRSGSPSLNSNPYSLNKSGSNVLSKSYDSRPSAERPIQDDKMRYSTDLSRDSSFDGQSRFNGRTAIGSHDFEPKQPSSNGNNSGFDDDPMSALYDGWNTFSSGVQSLASKAAEKVTSGTLTDEVSQWTSKVTESQPWAYVTSFFSTESDPRAQQQQQFSGPPTSNERFYSNERPPPQPQQGYANGQDPRYDNKYLEPVHNNEGGAPQRSRSQDSYQGHFQTGERQSLKQPSFDPPRRPQSNPARTSNGWGDDGWGEEHEDRNGSGPSVASMDDQVEVDRYIPQNSGRSSNNNRSQSSGSGDIYDFQVAPSKPVPAAGWDDWDDWGPKK